MVPAVRLEALLTSRSRFTFDGHANFLAPDREQTVSVDLSSLSRVLAAYSDSRGSSSTASSTRWVAPPPRASSPRVRPPIDRPLVDR